MNPDRIINCLRRYFAEDEDPPIPLPEHDVTEWKKRQSDHAIEDALMHEGLIEEYDVSPNVRVRRITYRGYLEMMRLIAERDRESAIGKMKRYGWYAITAIASSVMTILTTWVMKKLGL